MGSSGAWSLLSEPESASVFETVLALQGGDGRGCTTSARVDFALTLLSGRVPVQEQQCGTVVLTGVQGKLPSLWYEGRLWARGDIAVLASILGSISQANVYPRL